MTRVALEWGPQAIPDASEEPVPAIVQAIVPAIVVVDVLSFTTTLSVAMDLGVEVIPHPGSEAEDAAADAGATLAVTRRQALRSGGVSLSHASLRNESGLRRLLLPSPNGSAISHRLATTPWHTGHDVLVVGGSMRNATAVGTWLAGREVDEVLVIPAGERWHDGSLRPAVEDLIGSGAVIDALADNTETDLTPDASTALAAFRDARPELSRRLSECTSGIELASMGFAEDVEIAAELDASTSVPRLHGDRFRPA
jgi:2-phosphosulfolactate phosphatase